MCPDKKGRRKQGCSARQLQADHQPPPRKPVSETSDHAADGDGSECLDYECERYKTGVRGGQIDRDKSGNLSQRVAKGGYSDRGYQAAECRIGSEDSECRNATRDLRAVHNVQGLEAVEFSQRVDNIRVVPMIGASADVLHALDWSHQRWSVE